MRLKRIDDRLFWLPASQEPLSADVGVVRGERFTWFYDVGSCEAARELISGMPGEKKAVISHFHPDHMGNLPELSFQEVYVGKHTLRYSGQGTVVEDGLCTEDGCKIHIFTIPSSHAKGSLGLEVDGKYAFLGDAAYAAQKNGRRVYNAGLLLALIRTLRGLSAEYVLCSHHEGPVREKRLLLQELEELYARRKGTEAWIAW